MEGNPAFPMERTNENGFMKTPRIDACTLADYRLGRILLHLWCALHARKHWTWHRAGIRRELHE